MVSTVTATNARGASTAVRVMDCSSESLLTTLAQRRPHLLDPGYDNLNDAIDYGRFRAPKFVNRYRNERMAGGIK